MNMDQLKQLPEITDHILAGLQADDGMKHNILLSAADETTKYRLHRRTVFSLCALSLVLILLCVLAALMPQKTMTSDIQNIPAGSHKKTAPIQLQNVIDQADMPDACTNHLP